MQAITAKILWLCTSRRRLCKDFASTVDAPFNENWRVIMTDAFPLENLSTELQA